MMNKLFFLLFLFFVLQIKSQDTVKVNLELSPAEQAELDYNSGVEAAKSGSFSLASTLFSRCLSIKPNFEKALFNRSVAYYKLHLLDSALADINMALKSNPANAEYFYNKSLVYYGKNDKDSQSVALDNCLKLNGTHSEAAYYKGILCFQENDINRAIGFYSVSLISKPNQVFALNDIGSCFRVKQNIDSAIYFYKKAIAIDSGLSFVFNNLGSAFFAKKDYKQAINAYTKALNLDKLNYNAMLNRGAAYLEDQKLDAAKRDFEEIIAEKPTNSFAYNNLASIAIKNKDYKSAVELAGRAIELDVNNGAAYYNRGVANQMLKQDEASCADWKKAFQLGINIAKTVYYSTCSN